MERQLKFLSWEVEDECRVMVHVDHLLCSPVGVILPGIIPCQTTLVFNADGSLQIESLIYPPSTMPPLPRAGLSLALAPALSTVDWCGLGPHEAYDDRKMCVYPGVFSSTVRDLHTPYVKPQDNGRRAMPRWLQFTDKHTGKGIKVKVPLESDGGDYGWSASLYSTEMLASTAHNHELLPDAENNIYLHVDRRMMGVGGFDSWSPNVEPEYVIKSGTAIKTDITLFPLL
jgi:beta-galactosidase